MHWSWNLPIQPFTTSINFFSKIEGTEFNEEEIRNILKTRDKRDGDCSCPEIYLSCQVATKTGSICDAYVTYRWLSDVMEPLPERLRPVTDRIYAIRDSLAREHIAKKRGR